MIITIRLDINGDEMARPRVIEQDDILDAAENVVLREGAARLTLDAVAIEAGISKGGVIYDYKTKQALIKAIIERRVVEEEAKIQAASEALGTGTDKHMKARIHVARESRSDSAQAAVAIHLCAALAHDDDLLRSVQQSHLKQIEAVIKDSNDPRRARLAFFALEGVRFLEMLDILQWPKGDRKEILRDIEAMLEGSAYEAEKNAVEPLGN